MRLGFLAAAAGTLVGAWATAVVAGDAPDPAKSAAAWDAFAQQFDLDRDGSVAWVEYQQVVTGFAALDANHDGRIDPDEFAKAPRAGLLELPGLGGVGAPLLSGSVRVGKIDVPIPEGAGEVVAFGAVADGKCVPVDAAKCGPLLAVALLGPKADADRDGSITRGEWNALVGRLETDAQGAVAAAALKGLLPTELPDGVEGVVATSFFDGDGDGKVTPDDLRALFDAADTDEDGSVATGDALPISVEVREAK